VKGLYLDCVPEELRTGRRHVNWRYEGDPATKMLKVAGTLSNASSTNPRTWRTFEECVAAMERRPGRYAGVGRIIAKDDPFVGVDLDDVRDPQTGRLSDRAQEIIRLLYSYAEVSPSETGVKLWVRATLERAYKKPGVEIYPHGRYFTLTGWMLPQCQRP
jgi:primase-polymerase (primpol)-like protein